MRRGAASVLSVGLLLVAGAVSGCSASVDIDAPGKELMDQAHQVANEALVAAATTALQALQATGAVTEDAVREALQKAGAAEVETRVVGDSLLFGAEVSGGCVYGSVGTSGTVSIDLGGVNADGGCLREP
ncbi:hypothetical protein J2X85_001395 [Microbacterium trichothecenolyticum]|uniref:hypothetical protein n=1 Tax=Microbacterium trichothecenolyticum TaxID=69370 RepID=UPI0028622A1E|nr:hypothetical protein [Microbacterium trichothecenolyticum]MDR7184372.1 hypothetical protein [Microbacterium trichothecenolyticum]